MNMDLLRMLATLTLTALMARHGEAKNHENCTYLYTCQPGPTDRCCNLNGHSPLILQCQVSSRQDDFSIRWHYSLSLPDAQKTTSEYYINQNRLLYNVTQVINHSRLYVTTSRLSILGFDDKEMGYYWCSVYRDSHEHITPNPSSILFVYSNLTMDELRSCMESVHLHSSALRCADSAASNDVVNAQDITAACGPGDEAEPTVKPVAYTQKTTSADDKPKLMKTTTADTATTTQSRIPGGSGAPSTTIDAGVIILICATLSTAVLLLLLITGLLVALLLKKTSQKNKEGSCSSVVTTSNTTATTESRVTDITCEPNIAHEISISVTADYMYIVPS